MESEWKVDPYKIAPKKLGVTPPRTFDGPGTDDHRQTKQLMEFLVDSGLYEDMKQFPEVLEKLNEIVKNWVKPLAEERCLIAAGHDRLLRAIGLEFHVAGESIDVVCLGPNYIDRENDFFLDLYDMLEERDEVNGLQRFPDAKIPFMRFKFHKISINLFYARLSQNLVPHDVLEWYVLSNVDETTRFCLNGLRVVNDISELVPHFEIFKTTLMFVKYWAKKRGVRCNVTDYFGDLDWAILVARVCQAYPCALPNKAVVMFFEVFSTWIWPNPVMLRMIDQGVDATLDQLIWNPFDKMKDYDDKMPIITPAYPCVNSTCLISKNTREVLVNQFEIGRRMCESYKIVQSYKNEQSYKNDDSLWSKLCASFFRAYSHYVQVDVTPMNSENMTIWQLEGHMKYLWQELISMLRKDYETLKCHPNPQGFAHGSRYIFFMGMSLSAGGFSRQERGNAVKKILVEFQTEMASWLASIKPGTSIHASFVAKQDIPVFVPCN